MFKLVFFLLLCFPFTPNDNLTIYLVGDSTMATKPIDDNPERGWGQMLPLFFNQEITIENHAKNGRSTKSFINEGLWQNVLGKLKPGDYVFIQFGHNDQKVADTKRYAEAHTTYKQNLIRFVIESRERVAKPVLITPVNRRKFDEDGKFIDQLGDYPSVAKEVAAEYKVPLIDLHGKSEKLFTELGVEKTKELFLWIPPTVYKSLPNGKIDNTHFSSAGAIKIAGLVVDGIEQLTLPLEKYLLQNPNRKIDDK